MREELVCRQIEELSQFLPEFRGRRGDAVGRVDEMAVTDAGLVGDESEVPVSPPDDAADGLLAEPSAFGRHGTEDLPGPYAHASSKGALPNIFRDAERFRTAG